MTLRQINGLTRGALHDLKIFTLGVVITLLAIALIWVSKNYKALVFAVQYPSVVAELKVEQGLKVK